MQPASRHKQFLEGNKITSLKVHNNVYIISLAGSVAESVRAPKSNRNVACSMLPLGIARCCVIRKDTQSCHPTTSGSATRWMKAQEGNRKVVSYRFDS